MINKTLISVIIPVYNVETYLEECVTSVREQTYQNLEIILVDDGSTDHSGEMCDAFAKMDDRIKVIHKQNGGLSDARNAALPLVCGTYVGYVDSDDTIAKNMYETLLNMAEQYQADIAVCTHDIMGQNTVLEEQNVMGQIYTGEVFLKKYIDAFDQEEVDVTPAVWQRLYHKSVIENLTFPNGRCYEDVVWSAQAFHQSQKVVYTETPFYHYRIRKDGITQIDRTREYIAERAVRDTLAAFTELQQYLEKLKLEELKEKIAYHYYYLILNYYCKLEASQDEVSKVYLEPLKQELKDRKKWRVKYRKKVHGRKKKMILLLPPSWYCLAWKIVGILHGKKKENGK